MEGFCPISSVKKEDTCVNTEKNTIKKKKTHRR
jgi:hypothetical protein